MYVGLDMFGPFMVKRYRKKMKRYGIISTCLSSRAMYLEVIQNLETDSFRKFIASRGNIRLIRQCPPPFLQGEGGENFLILAKRGGTCTF